MHQLRGGRAGRVAGSVVNAPEGSRVRISVTGPGVSHTVDVDVGADGKFVADLPLFEYGNHTAELTLLNGAEVPLDSIPFAVGPGEDICAP